MAELRAMEDLVQEGRDRIRTAESGASSFAAHSGRSLMSPSRTCHSSRRTSQAARPLPSRTKRPPLRVAYPWRDRD